MNHEGRLNVYLCVQHKDNCTISRVCDRFDKYVCILGEKPVIYWGSWSLGVNDKWIPDSLAGEELGLLWTGCIWLASACHTSGIEQSWIFRWKTFSTCSSTELRKAGLHMSAFIISRWIFADNVSGILGPLAAPINWVQIDETFLWFIIILGALHEISVVV